MKTLLLALAFILSACGQSQESYDAHMTNFCSHASKADYCANYDACNKYFPINSTNNANGGGFSCQ